MSCTVHLISNPNSSIGDNCVVRDKYETAVAALRISRQRDKSSTEFILQTGKKISFQTALIVGIEER